MAVRDSTKKILDLVHINKTLVLDLICMNFSSDDNLSIEF